MPIFRRIAEFSSQSRRAAFIARVFDLDARRTRATVDARRPLGIAAFEFFFRRRALTAFCALFRRKTARKTHPRLAADDGNAAQIADLFVKRRHFFGRQIAVCPERQSFERQISERNAAKFHHGIPDGFA